ncbi:MAG: KTSC domain-containing protein [Verrucomicrobiota bacterium]|nr:KTSC domain-containing protein [Verrucomicrobiota bacterium]
MAAPVSTVKMLPVEADSFEAIGYATGVRQLFIKFRNKPVLCFDNVPGFRFEGLLNAPRKDAYYNTFIRDRFLSREVSLATPL